jgi:phosphohistidine phosphatase SixA
MRNYFYPLVLSIFILAGCKKDSKTTTVNSNTSYKVTSPDYVDSLLFVTSNGYQIQTNDPGATFSATDSHIILTGTKGKIGRLTSAEVVPITITWSDHTTKIIYALGCTDNNQDMPFVNYQGQLATDCHAAYLQGWQTLEKLPVSGETYAIVLRHADASDGADWPIKHGVGVPGPANWWESADSTLARQLNPQGVNRATQLGQIFKDLNYPIKRVVTSEFYRARQTATVMNLGITATEDGRINHPTYNLYTPGLFMGMVAVLQGQPVDNNMTLVIAHHPINELNAVTGYPSFPNVSPFNWTAAYLIKIGADGSLTYEGAASWGMFKAWRDLKLHKSS